MFSKFWHSALSVGVVIFGAVAPQLQNAIAHHPTISLVLLGIWSVVGHLLPSPIVQTK